MIGRLLKTLLLGLVVSTVLKNRYRIMNWVLGNRMIRQMVVSGTMSLPFIKNLFSDMLFSNRERTTF